MVMFARGKSWVTFFASSFTVFGMFLFCERSLVPVCIMICLMPVSFMMESCSMAFDRVGLHIFVDVLPRKSRFTSIYFPFESQRKTISVVLFCGVEVFVCILSPGL